MEVDQLYRKKREKVEDFVFDEHVASVFDDMAVRSIPIYDQVHRMILNILRKIYTKPGRIYDLGPATGETIALISRWFKKKGLSGHFFAVDSSESMLNVCRTKLNDVSNVEMIHRKVQDVSIESASVVIMNYTLQFIPLNERKAILRKIYQGLNSGGIFIFSEKIKGRGQTGQLVDHLHRDFKNRNGYSRLEIAQKREALEDILIPLTMEEQMDMLKMAGFTDIQVIFSLYNFICVLGIK